MQGIVIIVHFCQQSRRDEIHRKDTDVINGKGRQKVGCKITSGVFGHSLIDGIHRGVAVVHVFAIICFDLLLVCFS